MAIATQMYTVIVHRAEEGGYWGEVLELPGCASQGDSLEEFRENIREAIEAVLQTELEPAHMELQMESTLGGVREIPQGAPPGPGWTNQEPQTSTASQ